MIDRPFIFSYHPYISSYERREIEGRGKRDKVFVRSHVTYLCGGLIVYATYGYACTTTLKDTRDHSLKKRYM